MKRKVNNFDDTSTNLFKFFFYIFPFLLISGPFLPDLLVIVLSIYCIIFYYLNDKCFFLKKKLMFFFLIFYFYININSFFSYSSLVSFSTSLPYIRMILFSFFLSYLLSKIENLKKIIFFLILIFIFNFIYRFNNTNKNRSKYFRLSNNNC